jgi:hypothetical protein
VVPASSIQTQQNLPAADGVLHHVAQAIQNAAAKTGVSFAYLMNKAQQESSLDPNAKAATSSATGLFQFTSQTWLRTLKAHGTQYGLGDYAAHITTDSNGAHVKDPVWRNAILALRKDPTVSAEMAAELDIENATALKTKVGGKIGDTELYLAHFLGAGGASDFITQLRANPHASAAQVLPDAAVANKAVFYNPDGSERSVGQIYKHFAQKFDGALATKSQIASAVAQSSVPPISHLPLSNFAPSVMGSNLLHVAPVPLSPITTDVNASAQSLFATMVLAQMNLGVLSTDTGAALEHQAKHSALSVLGAAG